MFYAAGRRYCTQSIIIGHRIFGGPVTQPLKNISLKRNVTLSAVSQSPALSFQADLVLRSSLHIANIPSHTTDEEFRQAFSVLPGIVKTELIFNSGTMRDYKDTTNPSWRSYCMRHLRESPIRIQGYATEVKPNKSRSSSRNEPSHVLHISGLPLDIQYLEVLDLVKERCPYFKSLRFMAAEPGNFLGVAAVAFEDVTTAERAKERLYGTTVGGMLIQEHNLSFGRSLYEDGPTNTLMVLGTPTSPDAAFDFRRLLDTFEGFTTVNCGTVDNAWMMLEWFNREHPQYRVAFITSAYEYEENRKSRLAEGDFTIRSKLKSRPERENRRSSD
ncbi:RNA recognition motif protein [Rhizoctonia solani]|uniref:RNA recognition motif protein n=1 Tax=Rhizoctonia solani TaxID=456999 RepID=A0A8H8P1K5_9AGAM|nr:RNA recognition motif protein [Rhizoctonia solani]QRW22680.1 RNA recognition motif protein [Rhizoctonia solani]